MTKRDEIPFRGRFHYSRAERIADTAVHGVGIALAVGIGGMLLAFGFGRTSGGEFLAALLFVVSLLTVLSVSLAYNLWPISPMKWVLRRFDHAAIYVLIAGTYTPFISQLDAGTARTALYALVWLSAASGMALKIILPGRYDRLSIAIYLALGWSGVAIGDAWIHVLPASTLWLVAAGGITYTAGVVFFLWQELRFQNALWHGFVVAGATFHLLAMMDMLVLGRI